MDERLRKARFGLLLGIAIGTGTDNIAAGVGDGVALAVAFSQNWRREKENDEEVE